MSRRRLKRRAPRESAVQQPSPTVGLVPRDMRITRHEDGRLTCDGWPPVLQLSTELVRAMRSRSRIWSPERCGTTVEGDVIRFDFSPPTDPPSATYLIITGDGRSLYALRTDPPAGATYACARCTSTWPLERGPKCPSCGKAFTHAGVAQEPGLPTSALADQQA